MQVTIETLNKRKRDKETFTCITSYEATLTRLINEAGIECILVGDSLGMVVQGHPTTIPVSINDIKYHLRCVARANTASFIIADMPFMSHPDIPTALLNAKALMQAGARMVKLEGGAELAETVRALVTNSIPVCVHIGLLPQNIHVEGNYKVKGRTKAEVKELMQNAKLLEAAGAQLLVMECTLASVAKQVDEAIQIPTIGIGAGPSTTAQVLVAHDVLGMYKDAPKFSRNFLAEAQSIQDALIRYHQAVKSREFPDFKHSFTE